jgi:uncharacterized small protein (DUF1192 family)
MGTATTQAASFTYHGSLSDGGQPANGRYDLQIVLYGDKQGSVALTPAVTVLGLDVHDGSFSTELDLGNAAQDGGWIGVAVRPAGASDFAALSGRSKVEPAGTCPASWLLDGNAGTTGANYLGTTDAVDLVLKAGGVNAGAFSPDASFKAGSGHATAARAVSLNFGFAEAEDSVAAGFSGIVNPADHGSFVFGDDTNGTFETTFPQQFLVRAGGGVMLNGNSLFSSNDDLNVYPRSSGDADSDLRLVSRGAHWGLMFVSDNSGVMHISAENGVHLDNPVEIDGALDAKSLSIEGGASKSTAGGWSANSDARIKRDIEPVADALDTLAKLRPVTFRYTDAYLADHAGVTDGRYYNVIAQEFAEVFPDAVKGSGEYLEGLAKTPGNEILQVDTYPAEIVTIAAVQELADRNAALEATVERLMTRLAKLEAARGK